MPHHRNDYARNGEGSNGNCLTLKPAFQQIFAINTLGINQQRSDHYWHGSKIMVIRVPTSNFCYHVIPLRIGETLSNDRALFGFELREFRFGKAEKMVLCPYWKKTKVGTIECKKFGVEVFNEFEGFEDAASQFINHFGPDGISDMRSRPTLLSDKLKLPQCIAFYGE
jgi:hypothetical protein